MTNKEMVPMKKPDSQLRLYLPNELCDRAGIASGRPVILSGTEDGIYISSAKAAEQECVHQMIRDMDMTELENLCGFLGGELLNRLNGI